MIVALGLASALVLLRGWATMLLLGVVHHELDLLRPLGYPPSMVLALLVALLWRPDSTGTSS